MSLDPSTSGTKESKAWHVLDRSAVEEILGTSAHGLDAPEVQARLARYGPNALEEAPPPNPLAIFLHQFQSPLIYILLIATIRHPSPGRVRRFQRYCRGARAQCSHRICAGVPG